jgi:integrase/recombinase XerD
MGYTDLVAFDPGKVKDVNGRKMYTSSRGKTGVEFTFMLLKPALEILRKYGGRLPLLSNVKYNQYLKAVAQMAGVDKPLTTHWARHTGATLLLNAGVDMETVAKILGHTSTKITRSIYAKLLDDTVAREMEKVERC